MKRMLFTMLLFAVCALGSSQAQAAGFGFYGTAGGGTADWTLDSSSLSSFNFGKDTGHVGFGLIMDTAPARDKLFNYQLNIGYDRFSNRNGKAWGDVNFNGLAISNSFGFGTLISPTTRVWFGPELRVTWGDGYPNNYTDYKINLFGFGIGPVIGMNLNYDDLHTLALKIGYQYINYVGEGEGRFDHTTNTAGTYSKTYDYDVQEKMLYVTIAFMFRTANDR